VRSLGFIFFIEGHSLLDTERKVDLRRQGTLVRVVPHLEEISWQLILIDFDEVYVFLRLAEPMKVLLLCVSLLELMLLPTFESILARYDMSILHQFFIIILFL
jgi:hypothetical protein